jgi:hypothetical protein
MKGLIYKKNLAKWGMFSLLSVASILWVGFRLPKSARGASESLSVESLGIEEKEVIAAALARLGQKELKLPAILQMGEALDNPTLPLLMTHSKTQDQIFFRKNLGFVFPETFFTSDPLSQESTLHQFLITVAQSNALTESFLAKTPSSHP